MQQWAARKNGEFGVEALPIGIVLLAADNGSWMSVDVLAPRRMG
jgi:hypothetical protein